MYLLLYTLLGYFYSVSIVAQFPSLLSSLKSIVTTTMSGRNEGVSYPSRTLVSAFIRTFLRDCNIRNTFIVVEQDNTNDQTERMTHSLNVVFNNNKIKEDQKLLDARNALHSPLFARDVHF